MPVIKPAGLDFDEQYPEPVIGKDYAEDKKK